MKKIVISLNYDFGELEDNTALRESLYKSEFDKFKKDCVTVLDYDFGTTITIEVEMVIPHIGEMICFYNADFQVEKVHHFFKGGVYAETYCHAVYKRTL